MKQKAIIDEAGTEEDWLRILLAHVVTVLEQQWTPNNDCPMCQNAKAAAAVSPTKGHRR